MVKYRKILIAVALPMQAINAATAREKSIWPRSEPDFGVTSLNYDFAELIARETAPS
jgi:hypothetical protein